MRQKATNIVLLLTLFVISESDGQQSNIACGFPGNPRYGSFGSSAMRFSLGEQVEYICQEGFVLFGPGKRTCQTNGTWSDVLPECRQNVALGKPTLQSSTLWQYSPDLAVDSNTETCSFTPRSSEQRWWQVHLGSQSLNVQSVAITISPGSYQKFTIFVIELLEGNKAMYKPCSKFDGTFETKKAVFLCNDGLGHPGQFVYIRDDRDEQEYFGLCEVEVFEYQNETLCGDPEQPLFSTVDRKSDNNTIIYGCLKGYKMLGNEDSNTRHCVNGVWKGPPPPACSEVRCDDPLSVKDGFIEVSNFKGKYVYGSLATYHCNPGHVLWGNASRLCSQEGTWTGTQPQCKPITCGPPPEVAHSHYKLLNATSSWLSQVEYTCKSGHRMAFEHHLQHLGRGDRNVSSAPVPSTVTAMCSDLGIWQPINFQCIFDPLAVNLKDGANYDWTTAFQENGSLKMGTLVTISVLGVLVLLVVFIVIGFFWQQRQSLQNTGERSDDSPKIWRSSTNQLIADVAKGLASHFDGPEPLQPDDYDYGRSAGDGGSEEGHYASLKPISGDYALGRRPDGCADDPTYSSLNEQPRSREGGDNDGGYESLQHFAGSIAAYESLPRSKSSSSPSTQHRSITTNLVGIHSFSRSSSLRRQIDENNSTAAVGGGALYAQVDRSKKKRQNCGDSSGASDTCSPVSNPLRNLLDHQLQQSSSSSSSSPKEPLYATIGHKQRPTMHRQGLGNCGDNV